MDDKNMQKYLEGLDYPATKQDIVDKANENDAPDEVMVKIDMLDEKEYDSYADINKVLKKK